MTIFARALHDRVADNNGTPHVAVILKKVNRHCITFFGFNHKNYNFLACDWFKKVLFSTNPLAKLLSDSLLLDSLLLDSLLSDKSRQFKEVV